MNNLDAYIEQEEARLRAIQELLQASVQEAKPLPKVETHQEQEPDGLSGLKEQKREVFGEMNRLHAILSHVKTDEERKVVAARIVTLDDQLRGIWKQLDCLTETGKPLAVEKPKIKPEGGAPDFEKDSPAQLLKKRNNARSYVSKAVKKGYPLEKVERRKQWIEAINKHLGA